MTAILCLVALSTFAPRHQTPERLDTCAEIVRAAEREGVPPHIALAVGYVESRYTPTARSGAGAVGAMQIIPRWICPGRTLVGCDPVLEGVRLLRRSYLRRGSWTLVFCHYSAGTRCTDSGRRYADKVNTRRAVLSVLLTAHGLRLDAGLRPPKMLP